MTEDLYREVPCRRCGQKMLAVASFCPHCGEIVKESWLEKRFGKGQGEGGRGINVVPVLIGIIIAGYFLYTAIEAESIQALIFALFALFLALRSMFSGSRQSADAHAGDEPSAHVSEDVSTDPLADNFFCENCGTKVSADATACPKCGMKFG